MAVIVHAVPASQVLAHLRSIRKVYNRGYLKAVSQDGASFNSNECAYYGISCIMHHTTQTDFREIAGVKSKGEDRDIPPIFRVRSNRKLRAFRRDRVTR